MIEAHRSATTSRFRAMGYGTAFGLLWLVLAALRPDTTFHLATPIIGGGVVLVASLESVIGRRRRLVFGVAGFGLAVVTSVVIAGAGWMEGPSLLPVGGPLLEAVVFAAAGSVAGFVVSAVLGDRLIHRTGGAPPPESEG